MFENVGRFGREAHSIGPEHEVELISCRPRPDSSDSGDDNGDIRRNRISSSVADRQADVKGTRRRVDVRGRRTAGAAPVPERPCVGGRAAGRRTSSILEDS
jgi:hypothetical protein